MKKEEFREWLIYESIYSSPKQISDCLSRVKRVEKAFLEFGIVLDEEFDKDACWTILQALAREGRNEEAAAFVGINLPIRYGETGKIVRADRKMGMLLNATKKYILFRAVTEGTHLDTLENNPHMKGVYAKYCENRT